MERFRKRLCAWFLDNGRDLPWRRTRDPYAILVSEFMLQQTQVATVIDYYHRWMKRFPDIRTLAAASEQEVLSIWQGLGYYARARNLRKAAQAIVDQFDGRIPEELSVLERLPGLGPYTASAVASFAYDQRVPVIDANIARVLARLTNYSQPIDTTQGRTFLHSTAKTLLPPSGSGWLHNSALMELGALICVARQPLCMQCPVQADCQAKAPSLLPVKRPRRATEYLDDICTFVATPRGLLLQQVEDGRWQGLWKLPSAFRKDPLQKPAYSATYGILHYRVRLSVYQASPSISTGGTPFTKEELIELPMPAPHRRAVEFLFSSDNDTVPA